VFHESPHLRVVVDVKDDYRVLMQDWVRSHSGGRLHGLRETMSTKRRVYIDALATGGTFAGSIRPNPQRR
jgi:hypothetical protein